MRLYHVAYLLLASPLSSHLVADPAPVPPTPPIRLPLSPLPPQPSPGPAPSPVSALTGDQLYVIPCQVECVVRAHPAGLVKVSKLRGPVQVYGRFVDGPEDSRGYSDPFVYVIRAVGAGRVEIDVIPLGLKSESEIVSAVIDVSNGQGPIPPPTPRPDPPKPDPVPPPKPDPPKQAKLWGVVVIEETAALVADRGRLFSDKPLNDLMKLKGYSFRVVDKDVTGVDGKPPADVKRFLDLSSGKAFPQAFLVDVGGNLVTQFDLPKDPAGLVEQLKKWGQ